MNIQNHWFPLGLTGLISLCLSFRPMGSCTLCSLTRLSNRFWRSLETHPRRSNWSTLKEISHGCSLERIMLKLKLQYFGHLMQSVDSLEKPLMLGGIRDRRRRGQPRIDGWMASLTRWTWVWVNSGIWWWTERPGVLWFMGPQRVGHYWMTELNYGRKRRRNKELLDASERGVWKSWLKAQHSEN